MLAIFIFENNQKFTKLMILVTKTYQNLKKIQRLIFSLVPQIAHPVALHTGADPSESKFKNSSFLSNMNPNFLIKINLD